MKKAALVLILILFPLLYYGGVLREVPLPFSKEFFRAETLPSAGWLLSDVKERIRSKNDGTSAGSSKKDLEQLYELKLNHGVRNLPVLSFSLIREARQARERRDFDQAIELAAASIRFSPDLPQPYFALAEEYWHQHPFRVPRVLSEFLSGQVARFHHFPSSLHFFYNLFYILCHAILMAFIVFSAVLIIKYFLLYLAEIRKNLIQELSSVLINSVKIFLIFVPFLLRLDILWSLFFWSALLWGYATRRERQLVLVFLVVLVYLPFFLRASSSVLDSAGSNVLFQLYQANHEEADPGMEQELRSWLSSHPGDAEVLFTLGLIEKRRGRYAQAEELLRTATEQAPKFSGAFSNLGNVYMAKREHEFAVSAYQQAITLNRNQAAYYYNLYRAYSQEALFSKKKDRAFEIARRLDPELIDYYTAIDSPNANRLVIDEVLRPSRLWKRLLFQLGGSEGLYSRFFKAWFQKVPSRAAFLSPVFFLVFLLGMHRWTRKKRFLKQCRMCGSPTYRFYTRPPDHQPICSRCSRIFLIRARVHSKMAEKRSAEIRQFQKEDRWVGTFPSVFLSGFGYLWREYPLKGMLFLLIFFIFVLRFVHWNGILLTPMAPLSSPLWIVMFWGVPFVLFYIFAFRQTYRLQRKAVAEKDL